MSDTNTIVANTNSNPLERYYRQPKVWVTLPSANSEFLNEDDFTFSNDKKELAVYPMTAKDEILFQNPDALLNGEAVLQAIRSCVPGIKNPKSLFKNDIDFLLTVIKSVSYDSYDATAECPACKAKNEFSLDLETLVGSTEFLDAVYPVNLSNGVTAKVKPYTYETTLKLLSMGFEEAKFLRTIKEKDLDEDSEERSLIVKEIMERITEINFDVVAKSVTNIIVEADGVDVTDTDNIRDFLVNIDRESAKAIRKEVERISKIGLIEHIDAVCKNCNHKWSAGLNFDPISFFIES